MPAEPTESPADKAARDACHPLACEIQTCLQKYTYSQQKCQPVMQKYNQCIKKHSDNKNLLVGNK